MPFPRVTLGWFLHLPAGLGSRAAVAVLCGLVGLAPDVRAGAAAVPAEAEPPEGDYPVSFWRTSQGLPHNTVNALLQTRDGYLWVGTAAGLARFDGLVFKTLGEETAPGLKEAVITALLEDTLGGLWVGTQGKGVLRLQEGRCESFTTVQGLCGDVVTSLARDAAGTVWIGTQGGLNRWDAGRLGVFATPAVPPGEGIVALHAGGSGALWIATHSGVFRLQDGEAAAYKSDQLPQGRNAEFTGAYEDRSSNVWAYGATFLLNVTQGRSLNNFSSFNLASSRVWTLCEQSNGDFWIGTSGNGLFRFKNGRFEMVGAREGLEHCDVRALHADRWGNLWIGTGGNGLARLRTPRLRLVGAAKGLNTQRISALAPDGAGGLWVGTADTGLWHWDPLRAEPWSGGGLLARVTQVLTLGLDGRGALWVGTRGAGLIELQGARQGRLTTADGLSDDVVTAVAPGGANNSVWAGTEAGFLHRIRDGAVETVATPQALGGGAILCLLPGKGESVRVGSETGALASWDGTNLVKEAVPAELAGKPIRCLFEDHKGRLWVGSWGAGAFCRRGETWVGITRREGLVSEHVGLITQSAEGPYWFATEENLFRARAAEVETLLAGTQKMITFSPALGGSGLDRLSCAGGWPATARGQNGAVWLASSAELLPLNQAETPSPEPAPPVILERVLVNNVAQPVPLSRLLKLGPGTRSLDFEFTAINFTDPHKVRFRYKLENSDPDWVESDVGRRAHYGPLPAGQYRFRVIAGNADGLWNETGAALELEVTPPLWRAWWFLTLSGALTAAGIWAAARFISTRRLEARLRAAEQRHAMERERARIAQDMHDEIGSKLTRISFLTEIARQPGDEKAAPSAPVEAIASTSRELLQSLDEIVWAVNPRNDNLEHLAGYLEQHAREYFQGTACECKIQAPAQLPEAALTAELRHNVFLAFEEALNNSLKHAQPGTVSVFMRVDGPEFEVRVQDDGRGFDPAQRLQPEQDGLANMRQRLRAVGGDCDITSRPGGGTTVTLRFPLANARKTGKLGPASVTSQA